MCGIFAYVGEKEAEPLLLEGLTLLEYRGYDSAGIFISDSGVFKAKGAVSELKKKIGNASQIKGTSGIGHLRWATHGEPTEKNAHPHADCSGSVFVVHNGIIENYRELKEDLIKSGHLFKSDTDTEVVSHLVEDSLKTGKSFEEAVVETLSKIVGTYGLVFSYKKEPSTLIAARMGAPVAIGLGDGEYFIASDATPIVRYTKNIIFLRDGDIAVVNKEGHKIRTLESSEIERKHEEIDWDTKEASKEGHAHYMLKEIFEVPEVIENALRGRAVKGIGEIKLGGFSLVKEKLQEINRMVITACGTAYYAGLIGEYLIEEIARVPVEVEYASELRYRNPVFEKGTAVLAVSQSGETADTLEAVKEAKRHGAMALGLVNTVGSTISRETEAGVYNHAGPEIGVASTKAFISQIVVLSLIALFLGRSRGFSEEKVNTYIDELNKLPNLVRDILNKKDEIKKIAEKYKNSRDFLYIGRKYNFPVAMEGALKLKEISYIHAEGYGAGEMKHGPLAMISEEFPTLAITPKDSVYEKTISNIIEIKTRKGPVLAIATEGDEEIKKLVDDVIYIPKTLEPLTPVLSSVVLQLFSYYVGVGKEFNVDRPRNLAKSVTVE